MPELQVMTNDRFHSAFKPKCSVQMENKKETFTDFVAIGYSNETGKTTIMHCTDAVTLGTALRLIAEAFKESYDSLSVSEKDLVDSVLKS